MKRWKQNGVFVTMRNMSNDYSVTAQLLKEKILNRRVAIGIIGLGYVGLPLAVLAAKKGYTVIGLARDSKKVKELSRGDTAIDTVQKRDLQYVLTTKKFLPKKLEVSVLSALDIIVVCVPTPVTEDKKPDLSAMHSVAKLLVDARIKGKLIINESTVAPGTTRKLFDCGKNFLACSPERVDPGNRTLTTGTIPKIVGGINPESQFLARLFYENILDAKVISVSSPEVAEMSKMLENTYRAVNIALVNEFAMLSEKLQLDVTEVIAAASTKWSFHPHYPGIGVGGHCIPVDPYYILELARSHKVPMHVTKEALATNESMPDHVLQLFLQHYQKGMKTLVYGLTYKKDIADIRESPAFVFCRLLEQKKIGFTVYDSLLTESTIRRFDLVPGKLTPVDILVVATDHSSLMYDAKKLVSENTIIIDGRNAFSTKVGKMVIGIGRLLS